MPVFAKTRNFLRNLFSSRSVDSDLDQEVRSHLDMLADENLRGGMTPDDAQRAARIELGGIEQLKEQVREQRLGNWLSSVLADCRFALRQLRKSPGVTATVVVSLALGIGVNAAMFSLLNGWLLRPMPVPAPREIIVFASQQQEGSNGKFSYPDFLEFQRELAPSANLFAYSFGIGGLSSDGDAREIAYSCVTANYFSALGLRPALGRFFLPSEGETPGGPRLIVLGFSFWQSKFASNPAVIGKSVHLDGKEATVIGVAPKEFHGSQFALDMDAYLPLSAVSLDADSSNFWIARDDRELSVMGRLTSGTSLQQVQSASDVVAERLATRYPESDKGVKVGVVYERVARPGAFVATFVPVIASLFLVLAGLVLLLACSNVSNILLVRAAARSREIAIRAALGASRTRILRQIITETLLLAFLGSLFGVVLGVLALDVSGALLRPFVTNISGRGLHLDVSFDWRVFAYASAATLLAGVLAGLWPALRATRTNVDAELRQGRRRDSGLRGRFTLRNVLTSAQLACSLMLLIVAGLFVRSLRAAQNMYLGFNPDHVLNVILDPHEIGYDQARTTAFYRDLEVQVRKLPGVQSTSLAFTVPMGFPSKTSPIFVDGRAVPPGQLAPLIAFNSISPTYMDTMQVPLLLGRMFIDTDNEHASAVAIVNQAMAQRFWPGENSIGKHFRMGSDTNPSIEVIGVAANGQYFFLSSQAQPYFFLPLAQNFVSYRSLQLRTSVPPESLTRTTQQQIHTLAPDLPIDDIRTMRQLVDGLAGLFLFRLAAAIAAVMGLLGLTLATVGVYGVMAYSVSQRTHEIGIRMTLGARKADILKLVSRQGLGLVSVGITVGLLAAWALSHTMANLLISITPSDPATFASTALALTFIALVACYMPTLRATRVDPMVALRYE